MSAKYISGKMIRRIRLARGLTQQDLAIKCSIFQTEVSYLERKTNISISNNHAQLIIEALDMTMDEAIEMTNNMYKFINNDIDYGLLTSLSVEQLSEISGKSIRDIRAIIEVATSIKELGINFVFANRDLDTIKLDFMKRGIRNNGTK